MGLPAEIMEPEVESPQKTAGDRGPNIPILTKLKARNLYLNQGAGLREIEAQTGIPLATISRMASREGWVKAKQARVAALIAKQDARTDSMQGELVEAIASESEQHAMRALQKTGEALERNDRDAAKDSQAFSATAKNLVSIAKAMREPSGKIEGDGSSIALNIFFSPPVAPKAEKQVTEIEATNVTKPV